MEASRPLNSPAHIDVDAISDLQRWRTFLAIAELGSLTRAAIALDRNQSLLSRQINGLERDCGARLFNRTGRGVTLSEMGQRIFPRVKDLVADADQLLSDIRGEARQPAGRVILGALPSITFPIIGRLFKELRAKHPAVHLKILEGSSGLVEEWLADSRIDIAILYRYGPTVPEREQALATVDSYLIGAPGDRLTQQDEIDFKSLDGLPFILPSAPNGLRTALDSLARQERVDLSPAIEADSLPIMRSVVEHEKLYTVLPIHAVWNEIASGQLQATRIVNPPIQRFVSMAFSKSKGPSSAVSAVAAQLMEITEDNARRGMWTERPTVKKPVPAD